jgi:hypothetical protein
MSQHLTWRPGIPGIQHLYYATGGKVTYILDQADPGQWHLSAYSNGTELSELGRRTSVLEAAALRVPVSGYGAGERAAQLLEDTGTHLADIKRDPAFTSIEDEDLIAFLISQAAQRPAGRDA